MVPPQQFPQPVPDTPPPSKRGIWAACAAGALIIVCGIVVGLVFDPFAPAEAGGEATAETAAADDGVVDLTEGLDPFDPFNAEGYHSFTLQQNVWVPDPAAEGWEFDSTDGAYAGFSKPAEDAGAYLSCSDTRRSQEEFYPDSLEDPDAWFAAEQTRDASFGDAADDIFEVVDGPRYSRYTIDGHDALLVEWQQHWTQQGQPEGDPVTRDATHAMAYFYIDLGDLLDGSDLHPNTVGRCSITDTDINGTGYGEAVDAVLGIRI